LGINVRPKKAVVRLRLKILGVLALPINLMRLGGQKAIRLNLTAQNLLLTQQGNDIIVSFAGVTNTQIVLKNLNIEALENLADFGNRCADNRIFCGQLYGSLGLTLAICPKN
jgi:hypothetical protein